MSRIATGALLSPFVRQSLRVLSVQRSEEDLQFIGELIESGEVRPVIDKTYTLRETPDAIRYLETGRARGKLVIAV